MTAIEIGKTYIAHRQGKTITPLSREVTVVWIDGDRLWYRLGSDTRVEETSLERFKEIVE